MCLTFLECASPYNHTKVTPTIFCELRGQFKQPDVHLFRVYHDKVDHHVPGNSGEPPGAGDVADHVHHRVLVASLPQ